MRNAGEVALGTAALLGTTAALIVFTWRDRKRAMPGPGAVRQRVVLNDVGAVAVARVPEADAETEQAGESTLAFCEPVEAKVEVAVEMETDEPEAVVAPDEAEPEIEAEIEAEAQQAVMQPAAVRQLADLTRVFADLMPPAEAVVELRDSEPHDEDEAEDQPSTSFVIVGSEDSAESALSLEDDIDIREDVVDVTDNWSTPVIDLNDDLFPADVAEPNRRFRR